MPEAVFGEAAKSTFDGDTVSLVQSAPWEFSPSQKAQKIPVFFFRTPSETWRWDGIPGKIVVDRRKYRSVCVNEVAE